VKSTIRSIFLYTLFLINFLAFGGFPAGTLVLSGNTHIPIEELNVGDLVTCYDFESGYTEKPILATTTRTANEIVFLVINDIKIATAKEQRFYLSDQKKWKKAVDLQVGDCLFGSRLKEKSCIVQQIEQLKYDDILYDISVKDCHNFLILKDGILVHNVPFFAAIGVKIVFDSIFAFASYEVTQVAATAAVGAVCYAVNYSCKSKNNNNNSQSDSNSNSSPQGFVPGPPGNNNNDDDKNKNNKVVNKAKEVAHKVKEAAKDAAVTEVANKILETVANTYSEYTSQPPYQHTNQAQEHDYRYWQEKKAKAASVAVDPYPSGVVYKGVDYHSKDGYIGGYNGGVKSPAPINGQAALNNSFQIESMPKQRVGISENQIVIFKQTGHGEYHGYVPTWEYICSTPHMSGVKNELTRRRLVNRKGKIRCR